MDVEKYFASLSGELLALKDRIRHLIQGEHWLTDGEWKESALRTILRRHVPSHIQVARGFFLSKTYTSKQVDILMHDASYPVLFQDGDLAMVTPDAVRCILEVKSEITSGLNKWRAITNKLMVQASHVNTTYQPTMVGLFAYEGPRNAQQIRDLVIDLEHRIPEPSSVGAGTIHVIALGPDYFVRYWSRIEARAPSSGPRLPEGWRAYHVPGMAFGYFIHNIIQHMAYQSVNDHKNMWFPEEGKSGRVIYPLGPGQGVEEPEV